MGVIDLATIQADTVRILEDWEEDLIIKRSTESTSDEVVTTRTWPTITTYSGDWQPVSGDTIRAEAGLQVKSKAQVIFAVTATNIQEGDRVERADGSYMLINYIKVYEDHRTVFLTDTENEGGA